jgi:phenylpropionate dioxygenase-like ring-hydroxylating dioxygenase large terminal subunit
MANVTDLRTEPDGSPDEPRPRHRVQVAREGEDGVYSQTWYPICRANEVAAGAVIGREFLGGRIAVYRGTDQQIRVVSGYCVHMGADLSIGSVVGNNLRCRFHHFEYGDGGYCVKTGIGAPPPKGARIFEFPSVERYGLVWAFNGEAPLWPLPDLDYPDEQLVLVERDVNINCEPYMLTANAFDWQHFGLLHDFHSSSPMTDDDIEWQKYKCGFRFSGKHWQGEPIDYRIEIFGTNIYLQQGTLSGKWYAMLAPVGLLRPGSARTYMQILVRYGHDSGLQKQEAWHAAEALADMEMRFVLQDQEILNTIHFGAGYLVAEDRPFTRFLKYLRSYPRANPARNYLE